MTTESRRPAPEVRIWATASDEAFDYAIELGLDFVGAPELDILTLPKDGGFLPFLVVLRGVDERKPQKIYA